MSFYQGYYSPTPWALPTAFGISYSFVLFIGLLEEK